jgi:excisionase family DNA binding protein
MVQGFYTLEEAANILGIEPDQLNRMAQKREIRAFADRGTWRFRTQDIDELALQKQGGGGSSLSTPSKLDVLAKLNQPAPGASQLKSSKVSAVQPSVQSGLQSPSKVSKTPMPEPGPSASDDVFSFSLSPESSKVELGPDVGGLSAGGSGSGRSKTQPPMSTGDSAARLVPSDDFKLELGPEGGIPLVPDDSAPAAVGDQPPPPPGDPSLSAKKTNIGPARQETSVRLVPLEDNDVQLGPIDLSATTDDDLVAIGEQVSQREDSDVRLDSIAAPRSHLEQDSGGTVQTEEMIDLDAESASAEAASGLEGSDEDLMEPAGESSDSTGELSASDADAAGSAPASDFASSASDFEQTIDSAPGSDVLEPESDLGESESESLAPAGDDSEDELKPTSEVQLPDLPETSPFELSDNDLTVPAGEDLSGSTEEGDFELSLAPDEGGGEELQLSTEGSSDDEVDLGGMPALKGSGLSRAGQSGINLQSPADSGLGLGQADEGTTDEVTYELSLDEAIGPKTGAGDEAGSDSEFELSVEDAGELSEMEVPAADDGGEKDIFETDFDLPALDEESASEAVQIEESDTDLDSSDFDLTLDETGELSVADDSGSEVVALEEEEASSLPQTRLGSSDDDVSTFDELLSDDAVAATDASMELETSSAEVEGVSEELETGAQTAPGPVVSPAAESPPPAEWGALPVALMVPCVLIMLLAGLMSYELLHGMWGYQQPYKPTGLVVQGIAQFFELEPTTHNP